MIAHLPPLLRALVPDLPQGVDPARHRSAEMIRTFERSAALPCFSVPFRQGAGKANEALMSGTDLVGVRVHEDLHRFDVRVEPPRAGKGPRPINKIGQRVASIQVTWRPIPDDYMAQPGVEPPPTPFDPTRSQRFIMEDGHFVFQDKNRSSFHGFAAGRTFPSVIDGKPQLRLGAVADVLQGSGAFANLPGLVAVDGIITPPSFMALSVTPLFVDYSGDLLTRSTLAPLRPQGEPDDLFLTFVAQAGPQDPLPILPSDDGMMLITESRLPLRLAHMGFDLSGPKGLKSRRLVDKVVGESRGTFFLGPFAGGFPVPYQSRGQRLIFHGSTGEVIGSVDADILEGRGLPLPVPGFLFPTIRAAGIAPIDRGEGIFEGANGLVVVNGLFSLFPRAGFFIFVLRIADADQRIRRALHETWK